MQTAVYIHLYITFTNKPSPLNLINQYVQNIITDYFLSLYFLKKQVMGVMNMMPCVKNTNNKSVHESEMSMKKPIKGTVVLMKKNVLDVKDFGASFFDWVYETIFHKRVSIQLISSTHCDPSNGSNGKIGKAAFIEDWTTKKTAVAAGEASFSVTFEWDESMGVPGAFLIKNHHRRQFYLKTVELEHVPGHDGTIHFVCNSWVYPTHRYSYDRVFFSNQAYLPSFTPEPLLHYRKQELINLRGTGSGMLKEWDRVYDYAYYNDLGAPDKGPDYVRPVLGGSQEYPYPRRGRTGREPTKTDPNSEKRLFLLSLNIYVPRDERFNHIKFSDFLGYAAKSIGQVVRPEVKAVFDRTPNEFDSFDDVMKLYKGWFNLPKHTVKKIRKHTNLELVRELLRNDGEKPFTFPMPDVIKENEFAWRTDEEFGREMVAGVNPVVIRRLEEFPPASKLDPNEYGDQTSSMTEEHLKPNMNGLTIKQALEENKLFILDHHDALMPYLKKINSTKSSRIYATRTVLLLKDDGTLKPLAIELSLPDKDSEVYTPSEDGVEGTIWQLAKAYAAVNDSGYHQLISHWLNTHAVIEPFIIATNRQLSVLHPIYKLLQPHFRDTMNINALARQILINAGGVLEMTVFPAKYAMEMSAVLYKNWVFTEQALPADLLKRGVAVEDPSQPHGLKLLIEDYPFAIDGLEIWSAIKTWVDDYCKIYYESDEMVQNDSELQSWWTELRTEGHGDKKDEPWWPQMKSRAELMDTCTIIIWVASALHAAVNFGQYPYAGYLPNRPTVSRRFMPKPGTPEYAELESNPEKAFLKTITSQLQTLLGVSLIEILSRHSTDEIYLGQSESPYWTADVSTLEAFERFGKRLVEIEGGIMERNNDECLKNRNGPVKVPYTLLYPNTSDYTREGGLTGKGIPNSISI
ncbi:putative linoleate 9S-lipoxygenase [Helianthus annuus]|uniref:Lipoxygenase n=1 Tax=Helianthus annuus TaxID=4232 RepID=A0A251TKU3_HELAN|nr:probable linoleate 9S-lipoxygenase 5 [Helianthus annuus]KAF5786360.1 putative linoleate 9S-lipoxygenase [Helianthus annuus]KAJ0513789.1 putative linoleate 9S-lipoxygenase [Helianthus annuus]KAJ0521705.1 putative linoleate 9S-lipoxygenase [Helianthus annuus]KAJ0529897.1 putative linoleate 9S-lipoxygenase [Helianthus annuus]KAJ0696768.1 putative linoleate 9S-lipoxygenase [Helianthus annuus]